VSDALWDAAEEIGRRDAGDYLQRYGAYPTEDDCNDHGSKSWQATWEKLQAEGADEDLYEFAFEGWNRGYLGP
jgi:hypothetical protein